MRSPVRGAGASPWRCGSCWSRLPRCRFLSGRGPRPPPRRRREPVAVWLVWLASALLPFVLGLALALLLVLVGIARDAPPAPLDPRSVGLDTKAVCSLLATVLAIVLTWILGRSSVI